MSDNTEDTVENTAASADAPQQSLGDAEAGSRFNAKKIILLVVLPLAILAGGGTYAYLGGYLDGILGKKPDCATVTAEDEHYDACQQELAQSVSNAPGIFITVPDMIVNLNSTARQPRFLKISLKVELERPEDQAPFELIMPRVVDQFQTYLRELRVDDLRGSSGMYRMKIELLNRVRAAAPEVRIRDVLFQEILIQ